ncbi:hypothetical protein A8924_1649 [Saccharopolyspora erythraea NRRL 2338]|uniref:Uncharacterized protein n=2 Tax=Saccharopolyspora erythraea TaxID=1836 RepID=A4F956_SACEN|nr:hypothetical protein [Saccharopolyspora erythraea]EQD87176.1 hypothetical protein N599_05525 [Saccharopolyspora erythraea D]PFG94373.1 hypothetical protein A8924_1649 [Saccharopolyspora erythraea NRRL 2338]QRK91142.1 hypothetical protein JQX30_06810 [Saccharopolyspora erythraea]CAM00581.1 hypothetical protein SACE_1256 [Saccharopolyspora erythraea NRRL 2338]
MATGHITANYVPDGDDWSITVSTDRERKTASAPGLIAARDKADQLIEHLAPNSHGRVVIHLLDGDGFAFSTAYLQARHGLSDEATRQAAAAADGAQRRSRSRAAR